MTDHRCTFVDPRERRCLNTADRGDTCRLHYEPKHYGPPTELTVTAPTKAQHDAAVKRTGRPFTQDPRPLRAETVTGRTRAAESGAEVVHGAKGERP